MRTKSREIMDEIQGFVDMYYRENHTLPSLSKIAKEIKIAKTTVYRYLVAMNDNGMLSYNNGIIQTNIIDKCMSGYFSAPLIGNIQCGNPESQEEYVEQYITLPEAVFGKGSFYVLRACGDSMVDVGIENGDLVVIRKQSDANVGDIVVALDNKCENTLKTYAGIDEKTHCAILKYNNKKKYPNKKILVESLVVQGVAKHVIKSL